jgi:intracellular sulfur oxidation DsrE/DsrF family protein
MFSYQPSRRAFVAHLAAFAGATAFLPGKSRAEPVVASGDELEPWLAALNGKHRQLFHSHENLGNGIFYATRFKTDYPKDYGVTPAEVDSVLAAHGKTGVVTYNDAAWEKYGFGKMFDIKEDPKSDKIATHNIMLKGTDDDDPGVEDALDAGVVVLSCHNALRGMARGLAKGRKFGSADEIERDLIASLVPRVVLVPAMVIAIERAQKQGCAYQYTG